MAKFLPVQPIVVASPCWRKREGRARDVGRRRPCLVLCLYQQRREQSVTHRIGVKAVAVISLALVELFYMVRVESGSRTPSWPQKEVNILIDSVTSH